MGKKSKTPGEGRKDGGRDEEATKPIHDLTEAKVKTKSTTKGEGRKDGGRDEEAVVETQPIHMDRASQKEKAKRASSSEPPPVHSKRKRSSQVTPNAEDLLPPSKPICNFSTQGVNEEEAAKEDQDEEIEEAKPDSEDESAKGASTSTPKDKRAKLAVEERVNHFWWDYDNKEIPSDLKHDEVYQKFLDALKSKGLRGPVVIHVFVGYTNSNKPKMGKLVEIIHANPFPRPTHRDTKGNQASDVCLKGEIDKFRADTSNNRHTANHIFISGDTGFRSQMKTFLDDGYTVMNVGDRLVVNGPDDVFTRLAHQWEWRHFLGLPPDKVHQNPSSKREAQKKKERSQAHRKGLEERSKQDKNIRVARAMDENTPIPGSLRKVDQPNPGVEMIFKLDVQIQRAVFAEIGEEFILIIAKDIEDALQLIHIKEF